MLDCNRKFVRFYVVISWGSTTFCAVLMTTDEANDIVLSTEAQVTGFPDRLVDSESLAS